jgi:putative CocE/NonD family hydrolase
MTGEIVLQLFVSSDCKDTDFTAKLVDVYPDGTAYNLQTSVLRARYREGFTKPVFMSGNSEDVYALQIDLDASSNYFEPGHRIRLQVSSSDFPLYERNLNTGGKNYDESTWLVARNAVHHSAEHPSRLILPIVSS